MCEKSTWVETFDVRYRSIDGRSQTLTHAQESPLERAATVMAGDVPKESSQRNCFEERKFDARSSALSLGAFCVEKERLMNRSSPAGIPGDSKPSEVIAICPSPTPQVLYRGEGPLSDSPVAFSDCVSFYESIPVNSTSDISARSSTSCGTTPWASTFESETETDDECECTSESEYVSESEYTSRTDSLSDETSENSIESSSESNTDDPSETDDDDSSENDESNNDSDAEISSTDSAAEATVESWETGSIDHSDNRPKSRGKQDVKSTSSVKSTATSPSISSSTHLCPNKSTSLTSTNSSRTDKSQSRSNKSKEAASASMQSVDNSSAGSDSDEKSVISSSSNTLNGLESFVDDSSYASSLTTSRCGNRRPAAINLSSSDQSSSVEGSSLNSQEESDLSTCTSRSNSSSMISLNFERACGIMCIDGQNKVAERTNCHKECPPDSIAISHDDSLASSKGLVIKHVADQDRGQSFLTHDAGSCKRQHKSRKYMSVKSRYAQWAESLKRGPIRAQHGDKRPRERKTAISIVHLRTLRRHGENTIHVKTK